MQDHIANKSVMVTGCCGTVGSALVERLLDGPSPPARLTGVDNNETGLFFMEQGYAADDAAEFILGDARDERTLLRLMADVDLVFHCAAFKHVGVCERSPYEAIQTNIMGVQNVIAAALTNNVEKVVFTSSDKAVNPTNVMGASKLMGERLMSAANIQQRGGRTVFASTRFGNVLGSRGSVMAVFREQIKKGGPLTLTDERMTRFIMSIDQTISQVTETARLAVGGEIFIIKSPAVRIIDLAEVMIEVMAPMFGRKPADIDIETVGAWPGEKLYEELMSEEEIRRTVELPDYFVVLPAFKSLYRDIDYKYEDQLREGIDNVYNSSTQRPLTKPEIEEFLTRHDLLAPPREGENSTDS